MGDSARNQVFSSSELRTLMDNAHTAALATASATDSAPYVSLVTVACDKAGLPIILISDLAVHTKNLHNDKRASLLFDGTAGFDEPLTGPRLTAMGTFERSHDADVKTCFLERHPDAKLYADFKDFGFWRMQVDTIHAIAGFGRIETLDATDVFES